MILVTGGCGFIGSAFVLRWLECCDEPLINLDLLTYAGHPGNLADVQRHPRYRFVQGDIGDADLVARLLAEHRPRAIVHFAAESHVDRSISGPRAFAQTNVMGTLTLLDAALAYWKSLDAQAAAQFRFLQVSTDEVYGSLGPNDPAFAETNRYEPNSPYSASKAAADHFVRAYHHTYGLPVLTTNCSNNYGPRQFPEKLIPLMIHNARGQAAAGLWRRAANSRLAVCRRPLQRDSRGARARHAGRGLQHRRPIRTHQPAGGACVMRHA